MRHKDERKRKNNHSDRTQNQRNDLEEKKREKGKIPEQKHEGSKKQTDTMGEVVAKSGKYSAAPLQLGDR